MSDFLTRIMTRAMGTGPIVRPILAPMPAPVPESYPLLLSGNDKESGRRNTASEFMATAEKRTPTVPRPSDPDAGRIPEKPALEAPSLSAGAESAGEGDAGCQQVTGMQRGSSEGYGAASATPAAAPMAPAPDFRAIPAGNAPSGLIESGMPNATALLQGDETIFRLVSQRVRDRRAHASAGYLAEQRKSMVALTGQEVPAEKNRAVETVQSMEMLSAGGLSASHMTNRVRAVQPLGEVNALPPSAGSTAPTIKVTIGRIEVRATAPQSPLVKTVSTPVSKVSLDEYLRKQSGDKR